MAQKLKANGGDNPIANIGALDETIRNVFREIYNTEMDMDRAKDQHVRPLQKARTKLWRQLKSDSNIDQEDLKLGYKHFKRYRQAGELEDADTDRIRDNLRTVYRALSQGQEMNWLQVVGDAPEATAPPNLDRIALEGEEAGRKPVFRDQNPYGERHAHAAWDGGWVKAQTAIAGELGMDASATSKALKTGEPLKAEAQPAN